jgi:predicted AAA+ superfamily ATPase
MNFERKAYQFLLNWKKKQDRKPLIIRGARQVGKSTLVEEFSNEYIHFISLNLEKPPYRKIFDEVEITRDIVNAIFLRTGTPLDGESTLLFIDEIQESPRAIQQLRYIHEEYPQIHLIAAGSLLEFALKKVTSFPVGRVEQMVLFPFDFDEFLMALNRKDVLKELNTIPVNLYAHNTLLGLFHQYAIIGGMPEVVKRYIAEDSLINLSPIYDNLWQSYRDDVEKYASNSTERKIIRHIIDTAATEKDRVTLAGFGNSNYKSREVGEAIRALDLARIVQLIYPTTCLQPPLFADLRRKPRLQFLDTGLLNYSLGLQAELIGIQDLNSFYRGKIIQHLVAQQIQAQMNSLLYKPMFWVREEANSSSEVDLVYQYKKYVIPIEIKSGEQGRLRSLHQFIERTNHRYAVRLLANNFSVENVKTPSGVPYILMNLPYYLSTRIPQYVDWFVSNYRQEM